MSNHQSQIDSTQFGTVARYLYDTRSPIRFILHVKDESMLPDLAARLDAAITGSRDQSVAVPSVIDPLLENGSLRISSRYPMQANDPSYLVAASSIPKLAACRVIYLPPFYLAHTPGLFEGTLVQPEQRLRQGPTQRMKL